ncbi:ThuA domain-containing protein [Flavobacterium sp. Root186]|uniref:ThuA domain-containing protein n=1 Tax=Flavobacterium sp. Root186 TaxID=1736485 RepID=UPI0006F85D86|nr:ThuA domain-containing protein [Flavobacterium sp. Root186]KRB59000.1 Crp/Fnr family transcriptional regulator [Flavobacterium sp. Root186]
MNKTFRLKTKAFLPNILAVVSCCVFLFFFTSIQKNTPKENLQVEQKKVLIFSKTNGYRHESITAGITAIKKLGIENDFLVDATEDSLDINSQNLNKYQAVIFLSTTGKILDEKQKLALQNFMQKGRGFVGIHSATNCETEWPWFINMIGATFISHPKQQIGKLIVLDKTHQSTDNLPSIWERNDEWYNFKNQNPNINILIKVDELSYTGAMNTNNGHPISWYHQFDGGRVFYTALGHSIEGYNDPIFLKHLLGGIKYAIG